MNQRIRPVTDWFSGNYTKSQLARRFNVSRPLAIPGFEMLM
ncbi:hypothetical protein QFZ45_004570 [Pseudomonas synxantha]|nr:hypothetical protein [Pseudomonas synxantha]